MSASRFDALFGDTTVEEFLRRYWGRAVFLSRGKASRLCGILTWTDVNQLFETHPFNRWSLSVVRDGQALSPDVFLREYVPPGHTTVLTTVSLPVLMQALRDGATVIVNDVQKYVRTIADVAEAVQRRLEATVAVNMYLATGTQAGFEIHYDSHDVVVLQLHGRKRWRIWGPRRVIPLPQERFNPREQPPGGRPQVETDLGPGDVLYVPRGWWHRALPLGEPTLHLSMSVSKWTGQDFLQWLVRERPDVRAAREYVPANPADARRFLRDLQSQLSSVLEEEHLVGSFLRHHRHSSATMPLIWRPLRSGLPWAITASAPPPPDDALVYLIDAQSPRNGLGRPIADVESADRIVPPAAMPIWKAVVATAPVTVAALIRAYGGDWQPDDVRATLLELARKDLIVIRDSGERASEPVSIPDAQTTVAECE